MSVNADVDVGALPACVCANEPPCLDTCLCVVSFWGVCLRSLSNAAIAQQAITAVGHGLLCFGLSACGA
eukprot:1157522-Pelagomonas_calceolata.AAC.2